MPILLISDLAMNVRRIPIPGYAQTNVLNSTLWARAARALVNTRPLAAPNES